jgi:hypothetical protein
MNASAIHGLMIDKLPFFCLGQFGRVFCCPQDALWVQNSVQAVKQPIYKHRWMFGHTQMALSITSSHAPSLHLTHTHTHLYASQNRWQNPAWVPEF